MAGLVGQGVLPYQLPHPVVCGGRGGGQVIRREVTHPVHLVSPEARARAEQVRLATSDPSARLGKVNTVNDLNLNGSASADRVLRFVKQ